MAGKKVKLKDQLGRVVFLNDGATEGATLGVNLYGPDGKLLKASQIINPPADDGGVAATVWKLIREVPANLVRIAVLEGKGIAVRQESGEWVLRLVEPGDGITVEDGDGEGGNIIVGLADVPDSGEGMLLAVTFDEKGRKTGSRPATITGTEFQIDVENGNAAAGLPTISLADLADSGLGELLAFERDRKGRLSGTRDATTDDLAEGGSNLYFSDSRAQTAVGAIIGSDDTLDVEFDPSVPAILIAISSAYREKINSSVSPSNTPSDGDVLEFDSVSGGWVAKNDPRKLLIDGGNF
ncbi:hypothetical protein [Stenotrophomonas cyclobalanopsidis]|uniref:hypothetical protein n=1 Tax=Stenotrophomonas cyclobalanopsidis TaxID=2771362 RepID=UPI002FD920E1